MTPNNQKAKLKDSTKTDTVARFFSSPRRTIFCLLPVILVLSVWAFRGAFQTMLFTDDFVWINHYIDRTPLSILGDYFYFFTHDLLGTRGFGHFYRPLPRAVFTTGFLLFQFKPWGYHLLTILVHLACVGAVCWLAWEVTRRQWAALAAALFFALHPSHGIAVTWVCAISDPLYTLFMTLASAWLVCMISLDGDAPFSSRRRNIILFCLYALALFSKESAMTFPIMAFVIVSVFQMPPWRFWRSRAHWIFFSILAAMTIIYFFYRALICGGIGGYGTHTTFPLDRMQANAWMLLMGSTFAFTDTDRLTEATGALPFTIAFTFFFLLKILTSPDNRYRRAALFGVLWLGLANIISLNVVFRPWYNYVTSVGAAVAIGATIAAPLPRSWSIVVRRSVHLGAAGFLLLLAYAQSSDLELWNRRWGEMTAKQWERVEVFKRQNLNIRDGAILYVDPPMAHAKWWMKSYFEFLYQRKMGFNPVVHGVNHRAIRPRELRRTVFLRYDENRRRLVTQNHQYKIIIDNHSPYDSRYNHYLSWNFDESDFTSEVLILDDSHLTFSSAGEDSDHRHLTDQLRYIMYPNEFKTFIFKDGGYYPEEAKIEYAPDAEITSGVLRLSDVRGPRVVMINLPYFFDTIHNPAEITLRVDTRDPDARVSFYWAATALIFPLAKNSYQWTSLDVKPGGEMQTFRIDCDYDPTSKEDLWIWSGRGHRVGLLLEGDFDLVEVDSIRFLN